MHSLPGETAVNTVKSQELNSVMTMRWLITWWKYCQHCQVTRAQKSDDNDTCVVMSQPSSRHTMTDAPCTSSRSTTAPDSCRMFWSCTHTHTYVNKYVYTPVFYFVGNSNTSGISLTNPPPPPPQTHTHKEHKNKKTTPQMTEWCVCGGGGGGGGEA